MKKQTKLIQLAAFFFFTFFLTFPLSAQEQPPVGQSKSGTTVIPGGQSKGRPVSEDGISADIFGDQGGRFHPFVIAETVYTDNVFATSTAKKDDFITTLTPGIWLAFPANRERLLNIDTTTTSPGGLQLSRIKPEATRRYQTYFLYSPSFVLYADHSNHDHINHRAEALFQYNLNSGISFDLIDIFNDKEEIAGNGITDTLYRHQDNLLDFITSYDSPSGKFKLQFTYSNYNIEYDDTIESFRDRNDNTFTLSGFYKFWSKTSLFLEYDYSDINFDSGSIFDSIENRYYGGVTWDVTARTRGTLKLGYTDKDFDNATVTDQDGFSVEVQTQMNLNPKRALQVNGYRKFHESDFGGASSFMSTGINIAFLQRFTEKWSGTLDIFYEQNEYNGVDRDDDLYGFGPAIRFEAKKWLIFDMGYYYYNNDSNISTYEYETHQIFLRATVSL